MPCLLSQVWAGPAAAPSRQLEASLEIKYSESVSVFNAGMGLRKVKCSLDINVSLGRVKYGVYRLLQRTRTKGVQQVPKGQIYAGKGVSELLQLQPHNILSSFD
jgi:hypothetical protein